MDRAEENKSTTYVDIRGDGMLQPLPERGETRKKDIDSYYRKAEATCNKVYGL